MANSKHGCIWWILIGWWWKPILFILSLPIRFFTMLGVRKRNKDMRKYEKNYKPPQTQGDAVLSYSYDDVKIISNDKEMKSAKKMPLNAELKIIVNNSGAEVEFQYDGKTIGRMHDNGLKNMVIDFQKKQGCNCLAIAKEFVNEPKIRLYFYSPASHFISKWEKIDGYKVYTLTGNTSESVQDDISTCSPGEIVYISYDPETEKNIVETSYAMLGNLPASASTYIEKLERYSARIHSIEENEKEKLVVKIMLVPE